MTAKTVDPAEAALAQVRGLCLAYPSAEEKISHGAPSFKAGGARGRMFVTFVDHHHDDGRLAIWVKSTPDVQRRLVRAHPERFFVPPYVGVNGWLGARLDLAGTDWIEIALLVEDAWLSVAPKNPGKVATSAPAVRKKPPARATTDAAVARGAYEKLAAWGAELPDAECAREAVHATWRVRKKAFAYFLDNHHGDGIVAVCVRVPLAEARTMIAADPKRLYSPAYIGPRGWLGVRLDTARVDWTFVARLVAESHRKVAPASTRTR